jgi:hypothetical protein
MRCAQSTRHIKEIAKLAITGAALPTLLLTLQCNKLQALLCVICSTAYASYAQCTKSSFTIVSRRVIDVRNAC